MATCTVASGTHSTDHSPNSLLICPFAFDGETGSARKKQELFTIDILKHDLWHAQSVLWFCRWKEMIHLKSVVNLSWHLSDWLWANFTLYSCHWFSLLQLKMKSAKAAEVDVQAFSVYWNSLLFPYLSFCFILFVLHNIDMCLYACLSVCFFFNLWEQTTLRLKSRTMPGLINKEKWKALPLSVSDISSCVRGYTLAMTASLTYDNMDDHPIEGECHH